MKKGFAKLGTAALVLAVALLACQTSKQAAPVSSIRAEQTGLAPNGDYLHTTIDFALFFGDKNAVKSWKVEMVAANSRQRQWSGDAMDLPASLTWDGRSQAGSLAPEGTYAAVLTVDYGPAGRTTAQSDSFLLDVSAPKGSVTFTPGHLTSDSDGAVQPMAVSIEGRSAVAAMDSWSLEIFDPAGRIFRSFDGKWPNTNFSWNGKSISGSFVSPSQAYVAVATLRDEFGNTAQVFSTISVGDVQVGAAPGTLSVVPGSRGFSPTGDNILDTMKLALSYGARETVSSWKVEILDSDQVVQKTFNGDGATRPSLLRWDGKNDGGNLAEEGNYTARLSVDHGSAYSQGSSMSTPFLLDITPPTGYITLSDPLFSPIEGSPTITLGVDAYSPVARIDSWKMEIYDPENHLFQTFEAQWDSQNATWDGKGFGGDLVQSAEDYPVLVKVRDEFGNVGELRSMIPVDILVEKTATGFRILSSRIYFKPYTADYQDVRPALLVQNMKRLTDLALKLKKFPDYKISLVGHAVMIYWDNAARGDTEQRDVLLPLSEARAEAVKNAMIVRGLPAAMFTTEGVGASDQLVPDSDLADRWQNRRVAFFIER